MEAVDALLAPVEASAGSTSNTSEMAKATIRARRFKALLIKMELVAD